MPRDEYGHYVNEEGVEVKTSTSSSGKAKIDIYDSCPAENDEHKSIHINYDETTGKGTITDTTGEEKETTDVQCYLTTACMRHFMQEFDDNCYELNTLRWFRDSFVSKEEIQHYYKTAPMIVSEIEKRNDCNEIYHYLYENVVEYCVHQIENNHYEEAYNRYKNSILSMEEELLRPTLVDAFKKVLKNKL